MKVLDTAEKDNFWRHRLMVMSTDPKTGSWSAQNQRAEDCHKVLRHLNTMGSGAAWLSAHQYEEGVHSLKVFYRARHSFVIDTLSGQRIDVKSCAVPTLRVVRGPGQLDEQIVVQRSVTMSKSGSMVSQPVTPVTPAPSLSRKGQLPKTQ